MMLDPEIHKAVLVLTLLERQPPSRPRDVVRASILANLASRFGGPILLYVTFAVFLAEDHFDELQASGMLDLEPQVQALLTQAEEGYQIEYQAALERAQTNGAYDELRQVARDSRPPLAGPLGGDPEAPRN